MGYEVCASVDNSVDALSTVRSVKIDLILMDIHIRGELDGIQTAEALRQTADVPIVFLTAHADDATLQRAGLTEPLRIRAEAFRRAGVARHHAHGALSPPTPNRACEKWSVGSPPRCAASGMASSPPIARVCVTFFINATAEAVTGWTRGEAIGKRLSSVFVVVTDGGTEETLELFDRAMSEGLTMTLGEDPVPAPPGRPGSCQWMTASLRSATIKAGSLAASSSSADRDVSI